jgi:thiamine-monophosphate kinase
VVDEERVPTSAGCSVAAALGDGEDYELLVTLPPAASDAILAGWARAFPDLRLTVVGRLTGEPADGAVTGWEHFR